MSDDMKMICIARSAALVSADLADTAARAADTVGDIRRAAVLSVLADRANARAMRALALFDQAACRRLKAAHIAHAAYRRPLARLTRWVDSTARRARAMWHELTYRAYMARAWRQVQKGLAERGQSSLYE